MDLNTSVLVLNGVGPVVGQGLRDLGIETVGDLIQHYPRRWEDYSRLVKISGLRPGLISLRARVERVATKRTARKHLLITEAILSDRTGTTKAVWFNQPFIIQTLKTGQEYIFRGDFGFRGGNLGFTQPEYEIADDNAVGKIIPIYPENKVINSRILQKLIAQSIGLTDTIEDLLPDSILAAENLMPYGQALRQLHLPSSSTKLEAAKQRLAFEELFFLILTGLVIKAEIKTEAAPVIKFDLKTVKDLLGRLPFELTSAQKAAAWQIFQDIEKDRPMSRLLKGDVGSGKTIVALMAAALAIRSGYQVAIMAPTEILARQHLNSINTIVEPLGLKAELLVARLKMTDKKVVQQRIADGQARLVVGTHALLSENVSFKNLGLVIVDEQHRFGVAQRQQLKTKAENMPHLLSMTATPIPRSLALVIYGELDLSTINELPPGRKPVQTEVVGSAGRVKAYAQIDRLLEAGQQAFIVCPLIDPSDTSGQRSVKTEFENLQKTVFAHRRIGLIHGRLPAVEKQAVMADFSSGKLDILVATSVIEVGVDVPNATVMIIEDADHFGLAALHQLRGRVGRSDKQSYCFLLTASDSEQSLTRLQALERTNDGFRLAQIDLEMRGPGEIYGQRQHGQLNLRLASILDTKLIIRAKKNAEAFLKTENVLEYHQMVTRINQLKTITTLD